MALSLGFLIVRDLFQSILVKNELRMSALLPTGFYDTLPPNAQNQPDITAELLKIFSTFGYARVNPPLVEFESSLLDGAGKDLQSSLFRFMDPASHRMLGIRADITGQIVRIANSRMAQNTRPLRLCYAGDVIRAKGADLYGERQCSQIGLEIIDAAFPQADLEIVLIALEALSTLPIGELTVDFALPTLPHALCEEFTLDGEIRANLLAALQLKDISALRLLPISAECQKLCAMLASPAITLEVAIAEFRAAKISPSLLQSLYELEKIITLLQRERPDTHISFDLVDQRHFSYHTGICFSIFSSSANRELGRGGRYNFPALADDYLVEAVGFTLYAHALFRVLPHIDGHKIPRVLVEKGTHYDATKNLRKEGYQTIYSLEDGDLLQQARLQNCQHIFSNGQLKPVS
jgi:ATP phosphoribosyltransferase regulatory subunit